MKAIYDRISAAASKTTTRSYSTSFSLGIRALGRKFHEPIYNIYGFVRLADEIVDTFHEWDKDRLMQRFREDTRMAIDDGLSLNPILHSFQRTVNAYGIEWELVDTFLNSMEMDLEKRQYNPQEIKEYILGSAEVVGLMCLRVFLEGDEKRYQELKPFAMSLGSAFQKINFLRDLRADYQHLGRTYFPGVDLDRFTAADKLRIEEDISRDFDHALQGIKQLPRSVRFGVYLAYSYYRALFGKIRKKSPEFILKERVRIPDHRKYWLLLKAFFSRP